MLPKKKIVQYVVKGKTTPVTAYCMCFSVGPKTWEAKMFLTDVYPKQTWEAKIFLTLATLPSVSVPFGLIFFLIFSMYTIPETGLLYFILARSTHIASAYKEACDIVVCINLEPL